MAKLEILQSKQAVKEGAVPQTSALALPLSLATNQGKAINSVVKAIGDIQNDLVKIETQNAADAVTPTLQKHVLKAFEVASKMTNTDAALTKFFEATNDANSNFLIPENSTPLVKKLIRSNLRKERDSLTTRLFNKVTTEQTNTFQVNINNKFNDAIRKMLSSDQSVIGAGATEFELLSNNKFFEQQLGAKLYKKTVDDATKLKNNLLLDLDTKINPRSVIKNEAALAEAIGTDAAQSYVEKAKTTLRDKRLKEERQSNLVEVADAETKVGVFTNILLRIDNSRKNPTDQDALNELPTEAELYDLLDAGLINEPMFAKLSVAMTDEDGFSDDETLAMITTQIASANVIEQLDEIEKSYITDVDTLKSLNNRDLSLFSAYISKSKDNFESHKDFKAYSKLIDSNIANLTNVRNRKSQKFAENIATRKQLIKMSFFEKVTNGMSPKNAYLDVLQNEFEFEAVPGLNNIPAPYFMKGVDYFKELSDDGNYFAKQNQKAAEIFNNSKQTNRDLQNYLDSLSKLDFIEDIFSIRMILTDNDLEKATKSSATSTLALPADL
tara:strand:+ start:359 stop:2023 length:1665 start_codon:yes stop_codon:yes gene_type:complete